MIGEPVKSDVDDGDGVFIYYSCVCMVFHPGAPVSSHFPKAFRSGAQESTPRSECV